MYKKIQILKCAHALTHIKNNKKPKQEKRFATMTMEARSE